MVMPSIRTKWIALHQQSIREGARVAFVGVADDVLALTRRPQRSLPLDAGGEGRATPCRETGVDDCCTISPGAMRNARRRPAPPPWASVFVEVDGIDQAEPSARQPLLSLEILNRCHRSLREAMRSALEEATREQLGTSRTCTGP